MGTQKTHRATLGLIGISAVVSATFGGEAYVPNFHKLGGTEMSNWLPFEGTASEQGAKFHLTAQQRGSVIAIDIADCHARPSAADRSARHLVLACTYMCSLRDKPSRQPTL